MTNDRDRAPVAVVGFSFRLPGATGERLWDALLAGRDLVSTVAADRWAQDSLLHPNKGEPGTSYTFAAGSLGDVAGFDAAFFGISPREAEQMDPQQRVLLELAWEAFEQAGIPPSSMRGSRCAVYIGLSSVDYAYRRADDLGAIDATTMTGGAGSIAANRISYVFDLHGPSIVLDTACSSSLVAFHQACQSIRAGESDAALVGGISLHLHPYGFIGFSKASMLSRRGRCSVFDADADGYVRSEGGGIVILKPLAQALADGNRILAVVAGSGVNSDGRKSGLTVPSSAAQAALLRDVYGLAGIAPAEIDYYEAHGTGTAVGDPLETRAIGEALGQRRAAGSPLPIGSIKGNVGHLEAAAGMAGLVKALYVLRDRIVPPNIHLHNANPAIDLSGLNLAPVTESLPLPADRRLVVGVSAFGFGGTNAHAVLTSFERRDDADPGTEDTHVSGLAPLLLSARSPEALRAVAADMARHLHTRDDLSLRDIVYSAAMHRDIHAHRLAVKGADRSAVALALAQFADTGAAPQIVVGKYRREASAPAFVYSGNGSQWVGMGMQLLDECAVFRAAIDEVDALYARLCGASIRAELQAPPDQSRLALTEVAQPALFAVQVALTRTLEYRGVSPIAVCGHSVGEVAAAWASGALSLEQAVRVIHARSTQQARTRGQGGMTAAALSPAAAAALLESLQLAAALEIAAINSAENITVAGEAAALTRFEAALTQRRIAFQRLALDYAFHSAAMEPIRADLAASLADLEPRAVAIPLYSTVTGALLAAHDLGAGYWWRNVREPVNFAAAIRAALEAGINSFVEIGPRAVLRNYLTDIAKPWGAAAEVLPSLTRQECGSARVELLLTQLELGGALRGRTRAPAIRGRYVDLPLYPWQRERFWHPSTSESGGRLTRDLVHPLLGYALAGEVLHWENHLDVAKLPVYADHAVGGGAVLPAAGFVEMALAAGRARRCVEQRALDLPLVIEDLDIIAPLLLDADRSRTVRLALDSADGRFTITSRERAGEEPWRTHATGRLVEDCVIAAAPPLQLPARPPDVTGSAHYEFAQTLGLHYGPAFRTVAGVWYRREGLLGAIATPTEIAADRAGTLLHPAHLDGAFQLLADLALREQQTTPGAPAELPAFLPVRIARLELVQAQAPVTAAVAAVAEPRRRSRRSLCADFTLYDAAGAAVARAHGVRFRAVGIHGTAAPKPRWFATRAVPMPRRESSQAFAMPDSAALAACCAARLHAPERLAGRQRYSLEIEPLIEALCASLAARAVHALAGNQPIDVDAIVAAGGIPANASLMLQNLLQMLVEDGLMQRIGAQWLWRADAALPAPEDIWSSLIADYPEYGALTARVGAVGLHLADRLRTGVSDRGHAVVGADSSAVWALGCTQAEAAQLAEALADMIRDAVAAQPGGARLRVLRVVGAPPAEGLALLPVVEADRCDLVVGAASQAVMDDLRGRWPAVSTLPCHLLDLDGVATSADALGGAFDLIVLGEGLADAPDPLHRLVNARALLLNGGRLVILEQHASRAADLMFGLQPRWWRIETPGSGTVHSRFCAPEVWHEWLARAGFAAVAVVRDVPDAPTGPYLMIAEGDRRRPVMQTREDAPRTWLLLRDASGYSADLGKALTEELEVHGQRIVSVRAGKDYRRLAPLSFALDPLEPAHWDRLLADLGASGESPQGFLHLAGLDPAPSSSAPAERAAALTVRAGVLVAWLQTCTRHTLAAETWVIGAEAGTALLPPSARSAPDRCAGDGMRDAALWGIARVAMHEFVELKIRWVDLCDPLPAQSNAAHLSLEVLRPDAEEEILLTADGRYVPRFAPAVPPAASPHPADVAGGRRPWVQLDCSVPGPFRNLRWRAVPEPEALAEDEIDIEVHAAGLNFRDVMYAMGLLPDEAVEDGFCGPTLGMEVSGIVIAAGRGVADVVPGDAVIAFAPAAFGNRVRTRAVAVTRKPAAWSFAAAATVPTAFFTAYYALHELGRLREGERVLIHGGAGGVGIAAIQLAKYLGAEIFVTAGTPEKRDFVRLLGADHVFDSRSLAFADEVLAATGGAGVDVVLNSLAGDAIARNLRLLRPFGRMLELGKRDFYEDTRIGLRPFRNNIAYFGIDADQLLAKRPDTARRVFVDLMTLFADGSLQALPHRTYDAGDIASAFRQMQASRHIGKIVVTFPPDFAPLAAAAAEPPGVPIRADATYLVTGGLSGLGLCTARWLVQRGARHLALLSRRGGAATPEAQSALAEFAAAGVAVLAPPCDVADAASLTALFADLDRALPPLAGVVHAAMVIEDALLRDLTPGQLQRVLAPKVLGALHLHEATRSRSLDFFVLHSSATTLFGNPGQAAYVAANMALEALANERRSLGLPVTCVGWGPVADAGYLSRNEHVLQALIGRMGGQPLQTGVLLAALEGLLRSPGGNLAFLDLDWPTLAKSLPRAGTPKFSDLARLGGGADSGGHGAESAQELRRRLGGLTSAELHVELTALIRAEAGNILRIAPERLEPAASLLEMGMDSLMAVELAASLEARLDVRLSALAVSTNPTIDSIALRIARLLEPGETSAPESPAAALATQVYLMAEQHADRLSAENAASMADELSAGGAAAASLTRAAGA